MGMIYYSICLSDMRSNPLIIAIVAGAFFARLLLFAFSSVDYCESLIHDEKLCSYVCVGSLWFGIIRNLIACPWGEDKFPAIGKLSM